jgi:hypothetical protein
MYAVLGTCPVCGQDLSVTRLHCRSCDCTLEGHFDLGPFYKLEPEHLHFVQTFIRCEGKLNRMQEELGLSYPTVRNRLHEVMQAMGYPVEDDSGTTADQRRDILDDLAAGRIDTDEAIQLLKGA